MKVSDYVAQFLHEQGITHVFELTGGMITHLLDSIHLQGKIQIVSIHHEQTAAFAADAYGRLSGKPGVAFATSGPGATNLITGIGSCYFDSSPAVFITGQVNRHEMKGDRPIRQLGFQETDVVSLITPLTKGAWQVKTPEEIPMILERAFALALEGRPGPVLVDIPMDIQYAQIEPPEPKQPIEVPADSDFSISDGQMDELLSAIKQSQHPLILAGGGVRASQSEKFLTLFAERTGIPVVTSLMAVDIIPYDHPLRVGFIGTYGNRWANIAIARSDLLIVLGSRLDIRQTGADTESFKGDRKIIHVDVESNEINNRVKNSIPIVAHLQDFLQHTLSVIAQETFPSFDVWISEINAEREKWPDTNEVNEVPGINPNTFLHKLSAASKLAAVYSIDVGQHQMWAAQSVEISSNQRFITSGGMGSMGFSLPAAIGAATVVAPNPVVVIAGDGGFQCNIQELQTVVRNQYPIKMIVLNNSTHGMLRQFQQTYFDERYQSSIWGYSAPNFEQVAKAYGIDARTISQAEEVDKGLEWLWQNPSAPALMQVMIDTYANVYPKMAFGRPIDEMEPFAKPISMEST